MPGRAVFLSTSSSSLHRQNPWHRSKERSKLRKVHRISNSVTLKKSGFRLRRDELVMGHPQRRQTDLQKGQLQKAQQLCPKQLATFSVAAPPLAANASSATFSDHHHHCCS
jgi:hypothetical protein